MCPGNVFSSARSPCYHQFNGVVAFIDKASNIHNKLAPYQTYCSYLKLLKLLFESDLSNPVLQSYIPINLQIPFILNVTWIPPHFHSSEIRERRQGVNHKYHLNVKGFHLQLLANSLKDPYILMKKKSHHNIFLVTGGILSPNTFMMDFLIDTMSCTRTHADLDQSNNFSEVMATRAYIYTSLILLKYFFLLNYKLAKHIFFSNISIQVQASARQKAQS